MSSTDNISEELTSLSQHVAQLPKNTPFALPNGYFDNFPARLMDSTQHEAPKQELIEHSPLLQSLKQHNPYTIPEGYFNHFKVDIQKNQALVVRMFSLRSWAKYAAAACLLGTIATVFFVSKTENAIPLASRSKEPETFQQKVSPDAIAMYLEEMDNLSLVEPTENEQIETGSNLLVDMNSETIQEILQEIPDIDISLYMDQNGLGDVQSLN